MLPWYVTFGWFNVSIRGICHLAQLPFHIFSWSKSGGRISLCKYFNRPLFFFFLNTPAKLLVSFTLNTLNTTHSSFGSCFYILFPGTHCSPEHRRPIVRGNVWQCLGRGELVPHMKLSHRCGAQPPKGRAVARNTPFAVTFEPVLVKPSMPKMDSGGSPPTLFSNSYILYFPTANSMTHTHTHLQ